jgi:hypothetical protein
MTRNRVLVAASLIVLGATLPLAAQVPAAPRTKVPAGSPGKTLRPSPTLLPANPRPAGPQVVPPTNQPSAGQGAAGAPRPGVTPQGAAVTPQAVVTGVAPAAASASFTAGLGLQPFEGGGDAARLDYARRLAQHLDSAAVSLMSLFRGTSGQPMAGATGPATISGRERDRWTRCRDLYWDFTTFATGVESIVDGLPPNSALSRAAAALDSALDNTEALGECDNVASMISAPDRWVPWTEQYTNAARHFYSDWYAEMREAHEKDRAFVIALNATASAGRTIPVPPALPRTPPYAGAVVR